MPLTITVPAATLYDPISNEFIDVNQTTISLEHSLYSISKWESKWHRSYWDPKGFTDVEFIDYIRCMTMDKNISSDVYKAITPDNLESIRAYMEDPMTGTTFREDKKRPSREIITSELIYFWMIQNGIPFECQKWHINRLLTLIRVCAIKNGPQKKMSRGDIARQNHALNAARRAKYNTRG